MKLLISACLLGEACRYDGASKPLSADILNALRKKYALVPVCPECLGKLPTPRAPSEISGGRVFTRDGRDVTENYALGAMAALRAAEENGCAFALMKERSPSCGCGEVYDGSFTGTKIPGDGICSALLKSRGIAVYGESRVSEIL